MLPGKLSRMVTFLADNDRARSRTLCMALLGLPSWTTKMTFYKGKCKKLRFFCQFYFFGNYLFKLLNKRKKHVFHVGSIHATINGHDGTRTQKVTFLLVVWCRSSTGWVRNSTLVTPANARHHAEHASRDFNTIGAKWKKLWPIM